MKITILTLLLWQVSIHAIATAADDNNNKHLLTFQSASDSYDDDDDDDDDKVVHIDTDNSAAMFRAWRANRQLPPQPSSYREYGKHQHVKQAVIRQAVSMRLKHIYRHTAPLPDINNSKFIGHFARSDLPSDFHSAIALRTNSPSSTSLFNPWDRQAVRTGFQSTAIKGCVCLHCFYCVHSLMYLCLY
jgi:hypothetical protein